MYFLGLMLLSWLLGYLFVDWRRTRELLPAIMSAILLVGIPVAIPGLDPPHQYLHASQGGSQWPYFLLIQMGIVPVMAAWYAQGLTRIGPLPWTRVLLFSMLFWGWEQGSLFLGMIRYTSGWGPVDSLFMKVIFLCLVTLVHRYTEACVSPHQRGDRSVREVRIPRVLPSPGHTDMAGGHVDH